MNQRKRARQQSERAALDLLRGRILSGIHTGHLHAGDRLPTYREISEETGLDLRAVARLYEALEAEGLVRVRGRLGVFIAEQERAGGEVLEETARWMVGVLREAWTRRIHLPDFPELVRKCMETVEVKCACIESTEDQLYTLCTELHRDFGFRSSPVHADQLVPIHIGDLLQQRLPPELRDADLLVTTAFHAAALRRIADEMDKPLVVIQLNPDLVRAMERRLAEGDLTVICVDPRFVERVRLIVGPELSGRIRGVLVDDTAALERLDPDEPVMISSAARARLGTLRVRSLLPAGAILAPDSAEDLIQVLLRFNLDAMK